MAPTEKFLLTNTQAERCCQNCTPWLGALERETGVLSLTRRERTVLHTTTTSYLTGQLPTGLLAFLPTFGSGVGVHILEGRSDPWPQPFNSPRPSLTNQFNHVISSSVQWPLPLALQSAKQLLFPSGAFLHSPSLTGSQGIWASHLVPSL